MLPDHRLALYEFIIGKTVNYRPTTINDIDKAIDFILSLNNYRADDVAGKLPLASEACFSIDDHIKRTAMRVSRLSQMKVADDYDEAAEKQIKRFLLPLWDEVMGKINACKKKTPSVFMRLSPEQRWLSPSDFGFHNAIEEENGKLRFVDFEYAGWDDPAKLLCDFSNQPDRILESSFSQKFISGIISADVNPESLQYRHSLLEPLYQIKWSCIIMNDFLPGGNVRSAFTGVININENKKNQLGKLATMLHRVNNSIKQMNVI
jgi:hypothetical protein